MTTLESVQIKIAGRWTREQHEKFLYGLKLYGKNWKKIQDLMQSRSSTQIRSHAQKYFIKMKKTSCDEEESQIEDNSSQQKSQQETITCPTELKMVQQQKSSFSFYLEKIVENYIIYQGSGVQFNFWDSLIDTSNNQKSKSCPLLSIPTQQLKAEISRNGSMIEEKGEFEFGQIQKKISSQYSCFEQYQSQPCNKVTLF